MKSDIGVGVNPPERECEDRNCAWHGRLPVRGRVFTGTVTSARTHNTVVVNWSYNKRVPKYERYERRNSSVTAHNPPCMRAREGDTIVVAECRPISKTKNFVVVGVVKKNESTG